MTPHKDLAKNVGLVSKTLPHTTGYEKIFGSRGPESRLPYPWEPPNVPTVLPTAGPVDYPLPGYSRKTFEVRCVDTLCFQVLLTTSLARKSLLRRVDRHHRPCTSPHPNHGFLRVHAHTPISILHNTIVKSQEGVYKCKSETTRKCIPN